MKHLYNNNFSEDELIAINNYKSGNAPNFKATDNVFDDSLFDNRRIFGWVSKLLRKNKNETSPKQPRYEDLINDKIFYLHLSRNLTDNLTKLTNVLDHFTKSLKEKPLINGIRRVSRSVDDVQNKTDVNENKVTMNSTDETKEIGTDNKTSDDGSNKTINTAEETKDETEKPNQPSGRRSFKSVELEHKLLSAINDTLNVIQYKIRTVSNIQELFSDRLMYKVGYIAGSLTAVKGLIDELQMNVVKNDTELDDKYILYMYDTVNRIKDSSGRLLELLNVYVDKATSELIAFK
ncbi:uncharacterized protein LOC119838561 [Zerene cesonia]|uniref:uncharacterized protein LOC119838561 n=1 Tax=Zerene cesonia TaxID=33412 RepID=UPI0018E5A4B3|nr:uncharacterized protein LOC119838561 [Zerene cesonia]